MVDGCLRGPKVSEDMVVPVAVFRLRIGDRVRTTHEGLARSRKMWTLNPDGDRSPERVRWLWEIGTQGTERRAVGRSTCLDE
jgi:hypothetical protein